MSSAEIEPLGDHEGFAVAVPEADGLNLKLRTAHRASEKGPAGLTMPWHAMAVVQLAMQDVEYICMLKYTISVDVGANRHVPSCHGEVQGFEAAAMECDPVLDAQVEVLVHHPRLY